MKLMWTSRARQTAGVGGLAGTAGGAAEILWIALYGALTGNNTVEVARSISSVARAVLPLSPLVTAPIAAGIAIHMLAAAALGVVLVFAWQALGARRSVSIDQYAFMLPALTAVWGF